MDHRPNLKHPPKEAPATKPPLMQFKPRVRALWHRIAQWDFGGPTDIDNEPRIVEKNNSPWHGR